MLDFVFYWLNFITLCSIVFGVVYFIGYWVSANYYNNFSPKFKEAYAFFNRVSTSITTGLVVAAVIITGWKGLFAFVPVYGTLTTVALFIVLLYNLYFGFHKSRKYFADKRNVKL